MKKIVCFVILSLSISCKKEKTLTLAFNEPNEIQKSILIDKNDVHSNLYGFWIGKCVSVPGKGNKNSPYNENLKIKIENINENEVIAKSIFHGNFITTNGILITENGSVLKMELKEDLKKRNGKFIYTFEISGNEIKGVRTSGVSDYIFPKSNFTLHKKEFIYDKNNLSKPILYLQELMENDKGIFFEDGARTIITNGIEKINASVEILTEKRLKNLKKDDLQIIRKTIYARHGFIFKSAELSRNFDKSDWYLPVSENIDSELTSIEKTNIELLTRFEKYAKQNYSYFGR